MSSRPPVPSDILRQLKYLYNEAGEYDPKRLDTLTRQQVSAMMCRCGDLISCTQVLDVHRLVKCVEYEGPATLKELMRACVAEMHPLSDGVTKDTVHQAGVRCEKKIRKLKSSKSRNKCLEAPVNFATRKVMHAPHTSHRLTHHD